MTEVPAPTRAAAEEMGITIFFAVASAPTQGVVGYFIPHLEVEPAE